MCNSIYPFNVFVCDNFRGKIPLLLILPQSLSKLETSRVINGVVSENSTVQQDRPSGITRSIINVEFQRVYTHSWK